MKQKSVRQEHFFVIFKHLNQSVARHSVAL